MSLQKPQEIKNNAFKSQKWDEITKDRDFRQSDIPTLELLCQWYAVVKKCEQDMDYNGDIQVVYENNLGDIKALPQLSTMKQASAEIRALNKQLGINDEVKSVESIQHGNTLKLIRGKRIAKSEKARKSAS